MSTEPVKRKHLMMKSLQSRYEAYSWISTVVSVYLLLEVRGVENCLVATRSLEIVGMPYVFSDVRMKYVIYITRTSHLKQSELKRQLIYPWEF